ncbi:LysR substrate-binding domain-containing protein [Bradyrhizobium sp. WSM2793]|uniref:LysR substrate-binding domain-containing protein n=1 Tax=Bradyrhizobium sp. WSM2793 TaxID=1038866 RepID=UPI0003715403|nr:LysR substrate-binding domain-containing protein [Bradyrhizobium sp. WSM2793]
MLNLRQIEAFRAVMETGSISRAAERLSISQPAVSKLIQNLELSAGLALFERRPGRVMPTPEAFLLFQEIERIMTGLNGLQRYVADVRAMYHAMLRIGVSPALSVGFIQDILIKYTKTHPSMRVTVQARSTVRIIDWLLSGSIDIGISSQSFDHPEVIQLPLCRRSYVCILPNGHRLSERPSLVPADLADEYFISFGPEDSQPIDRIFEMAGVKRRLQIEAPTGPTVCALVAAGLGVALINPLYIGRFEGVVASRPMVPTVESEIQILLPRHRPQSLATRAFIDSAKSVVASLAEVP